MWSASCSLPRKREHQRHFNLCFCCSELGHTISDCPMRNLDQRNPGKLASPAPMKGAGLHTFTKYSLEPWSYPERILNDIDQHSICKYQLRYESQSAPFKYLHRKPSLTQVPQITSSIWMWPKTCRFPQACSRPSKDKWQGFTLSFGLATIETMPQEVTTQGHQEMLQFSATHFPHFPDPIALSFTGMN